MTKDEALRLALEALETHVPHVYKDRGYAPITAIKQVLEQPEPEPVATNDISKECVDETAKQRHEPEPDYYGLTADHLWISIPKDHYDRLKPEYRMACYKSPPKREPLTHEEINEIIMANAISNHPTAQGLCRAIEAAHGIKGDK